MAVTSVGAMTSPSRGTDPPHLAAALRRPRYLVSVWPWRALAYIATTTPISGVLALGLLLVGAPLYATVTAMVRRGAAVTLPLAVFLTLSSVVIVALAPLVSHVVGLIERWRLGLIDGRRLTQPQWPGPGRTAREWPPILLPWTHGHRARAAT